MSSSSRFTRVAEISDAVYSYGNNERSSPTSSVKRRASSPFSETRRLSDISVDADSMQPRASSPFHERRSNGGVAPARAASPVYGGGGSFSPSSRSAFKPLIRTKIASDFDDELPFGSKSSPFSSSRTSSAANRTKIATSRSDFDVDMNLGKNTPFSSSSRTAAAPIRSKFSPSRSQFDEDMSFGNGPVRNTPLTGATFKKSVSPSFSPESSFAIPAPKSSAEKPFRSLFGEKDTLPNFTPRDNFRRFSPPKKDSFAAAVQPSSSRGSRSPFGRFGSSSSSKPIVPKLHSPSREGSFAPAVVSSRIPVEEKNQDWSLVPVPEERFVESPYRGSSPVALPQGLTRGNNRNSNWTQAPPTNRRSSYGPVKGSAVRRHRQTENVRSPPEHKEFSAGGVLKSAVNFVVGAASWIVGGTGVSKYFGWPSATSSDETSHQEEPVSENNVSHNQSFPQRHVEESHIENDENSHHMDNQMDTSSPRRILKSHRSHNPVFDVCWKGKSIGRMTREELKNHLRAAGLPSEGSHQDMVRRLRYFAFANQPSDNRASQNASTDGSAWDDTDEFVGLVGKVANKWQKMTNEMRVKQKVATNALQQITGWDGNFDERFGGLAKEPVSRKRRAEEEPVAEPVSPKRNKKSGASHSHQPFTALLHQGHLPHFASVLKEASVPRIQPAPQQAASKRAREPEQVLNSRPVQQTSGINVRLDKLVASSAKADVPGAKKARSESGFSFSSVTPAEKPSKPAPVSAPVVDLSKSPTGAASSSSSVKFSGSTQFPTQLNSARSPSPVSPKNQQTAFKFDLSKPSVSTNSTTHASTFGGFSVAAPKPSSPSPKPASPVSFPKPSSEVQPKTIVPPVEPKSTPASEKPLGECPDCQMEEDDAMHDDCEWPEYKKKHGSKDARQGSSPSPPPASKKTPAVSTSFNIGQAPSSSSTGFSFNVPAASGSSVVGGFKFPSTSNDTSSKDTSETKSFGSSLGTSKPPTSPGKSTPSFSFNSGSGSQTTPSAQPTGLPTNVSASSSALPGFNFGDEKKSDLLPAGGFKITVPPASSAPAFSSSSSIFPAASGDKSNFPSFNFGGGSARSGSPSKPSEPAVSEKPTESKVSFGASTFGSGLSGAGSTLNLPSNLGGAPITNSSGSQDSTGAAVVSSFSGTGVKPFNFSQPASGGALTSQFSNPSAPSGTSTGGFKFNTSTTPTFGGNASGAPAASGTGFGVNPPASSGGLPNKPVGFGPATGFNQIGGASAIPFPTSSGPANPFNNPSGGAMNAPNTFPSATGAPANNPFSNPVGGASGVPSFSNGGVAPSFNNPPAAGGFGQGFGGDAGAGGFNPGNVQFNMGSSTERKIFKARRTARK
jgi:hypothetical protein